MLAVERLEAAPQGNAGGADAKEAQQQTAVRGAFKPPH